jgi:hypothetical protein
VNLFIYNVSAMTSRVSTHKDVPDQGTDVHYFAPKTSLFWRGAYGVGRRRGAYSVGRTAYSVGCTAS